MLTNMLMRGHVENRQLVPGRLARYDRSLHCVLHPIRFCQYLARSGRELAAH